MEINTYEQLRDLDSDSNHLKSDAIRTIAKTLAIKPVMLFVQIKAVRSKAEIK